MPDDSRPPFILPDSVLKRRRGLLEGAMPEAPPRQWAEHLELLKADGKLTSVDDMLALMRIELDRLQEQIDPDVEPDRHSEAVLAAAMAEMLDAKIGSEQRESRQEVYFTLLLGYLYGRLTKSGVKQERETAIELLQGRLQMQQVQSELQADRESRSKGGKKSRKMNLDEFEEAWLEWVKAGSPGTKAKFDLDMAERFGVSEENIERERHKLQRELAALNKKTQE
ncbi:MAG: hypothetical protein ACQEUN_05075 [Pseudomonadota bacterium]